MRTIALIMGIGLLASACSKNENAGAEEAKKEAEKEQAKKVGDGQAAKKIAPPVPGRAHLPCAQLVAAATFQQALGEKDPIAVVDGKSAPEAAASCSLMRG